MNDSVNDDMNRETAPPEPRPRYALYYAPRPEDGLATTASQWLGRNLSLIHI